jgi:hypothetical protein
MASSMNTIFIDTFNLNHGINIKIFIKLPTQSKLLENYPITIHYVSTIALQ